MTVYRQYSAELPWYIKRTYPKVVNVIYFPELLIISLRTPWEHCADKSKYMSRNIECAGTGLYSCNVGIHILLLYVWILGLKIGQKGTKWVKFTNISKCHFSTFSNFSSRWKIYHLPLSDTLFWYIMADLHYTDDKQSQFWRKKLHAESAEIY